MSFDLLSTSKNLNKSVWFYNPQDFFNPKTAEMVKRDQVIINRIFSDEDHLRLFTVAFDKCVDKFDSASLSFEEIKCMKSLKENFQTYIKDLEISDKILLK